MQIFGCFPLFRPGKNTIDIARASTKCLPVRVNLKHRLPINQLLKWDTIETHKKKKPVRDEKSFKWNKRKTHTYLRIYKWVGLGFFWWLSDTVVRMNFIGEHIEYDECIEYCSYKFAPTIHLIRFDDLRQVSPNTHFYLPDLSGRSQLMTKLFPWCYRNNSRF